MRGRRDEKQLGRAHRPNAFSSDFDAREHLQFVREHRSFSEVARSVGIFENQNPVSKAHVKFARSLGKSVVFSNPKATLCVPSHRYGILHIGLAGKHLGLKSGGEGEGSGGLSSGHRPV